MVDKSTYDKITHDLNSHQYAKGGGIKSVIENQLSKRRICKAHGCTLKQYMDAKSKYEKGGNVEAENRAMVDNNNTKIEHHSAALKKILKKKPKVPDYQAELPRF